VCLQAGGSCARGQAQCCAVMRGAWCLWCVSRCAAASQAPSRSSCPYRDPSPRRSQGGYVYIPPLAQCRYVSWVWTGGHQAAWQLGQAVCCMCGMLRHVSQQMQAAI
jgi:hypothetical protein